MGLMSLRKYREYPSTPLPTMTILPVVFSLHQEFVLR